jgi:hypothetical protein
MRYLFNSEFSPLMNRIGFIKADIDLVVAAFTEWFFNTPQSNKGRPITKTGNLSVRQLLKELLPFYFPVKYAFIPTRSNWLAYVDNRSLECGSAGFTRKIGSLLNVQSLEIGAWEKNWWNDPKPVNGWGGGFFTLNNCNDVIRSVSLMYDDTWDFDVAGEPLPFEEIDRYAEKFAKNRFTPEMLERYCKAMGIDFFNEDFYAPEGTTSFLIEETRPPWPNEIPVSFEKMRANYKWSD